MSTAEEEEKQLSLNPETTGSTVIHKNKFSSDIPMVDDTNQISDSCEINKAAQYDNFAASDPLMNDSTIPYNDQNGDDKIVLNNYECRDKIPNQEHNDYNCEHSLDSKEGQIGISDISKEGQIGISDISKEPVQLILTSQQLSLLTKSEIIEKWSLQDLYIKSIQNKLQTALQEVAELKKMHLTDDKLKAQLAELQRKEQYHIMRLATKEHEIQEMGAQVDELKNLTAGGAGIKHSLLDPAVNLLFERMKRDFDATKAKMEETQNELAAWKFTPDSNTGKQLMAKCRLLIKENEELGKMISSGRLAKLEGDLALQRNFSDELKKSQSELEEFLQEMDEDTEGMQGTILYLQSQLRQAKEKISHLTSQLSVGGQGTSNNTPASQGEGIDFPEGLSESGLDHPTDDSLHQSDDGGTLTENSNRLLLKDHNSNEDCNLTTRKTNGDLSGNSSSEPSLDYSNLELNNYSVGRKRTQSDVEESGGEQGSSTKRTRVERTTDTASVHTVVENGLTLE